MTFNDKYEYKTLPMNKKANTLLKVVEFDSAKRRKKKTIKTILKVLQDEYNFVKK